MNDKQKKMLRKIIIGASLYIIAVIVSKINFSMSNIISFGLFIAAYIIVGKEVLLKAFSNIKRGKVFDENFLMTIATVGAVIIGEYPEAVGVMLFYNHPQKKHTHPQQKTTKTNPKTKKTTQKTN